MGLMPERLGCTSSQEAANPSPTQNRIEARSELSAAQSQIVKVCSESVYVLYYVRQKLQYYDVYILYHALIKQASLLDVI